MVKKLKEYLELKRLYRNAKKVLVINSAETIISIKNIISNIEKLVGAYSNNLNSISPEDISNMSNFMKEITSNPNLAGEEIWAKIHEDAQKLREHETKRQNSTKEIDN